MRTRNMIWLLASTPVWISIGACGGGTTVVNKPPAEPSEKTTTTTTTTTSEPAEEPAAVEVEKKTEIEVDD